jgi:hypothetical protein
MIYLLGVDHKVQWDKSLEETKEFEQYLKTEIPAKGITFVGEEFSPEVAQNTNSEQTTIKAIAEEMGIEHKYCDPDSDKRLELGIKTNKEIEKEIKKQLGYTLYIPHKDMNKFEDLCNAEKAKYFPMRENYWLEQILSEKDKTILFICGSDHIESFNTLLQKTNLQTQVLKLDSSTD